MSEVDRVVVVSVAARKAHAIVKSLSKAGYEVIAGYDKPHPVLLSRYIKRRFRTPSPELDPSGFAKAVAFNARQYGASLVVPVRFVDVVVLSRYRRVVEEYSILASPDYESVIRASDKSRLPSLLSNAGALYPRSVKIREPGEIGLVEEMEPPFVVKGFSDASKPEYALSLEDLADIISRRGECLVQEYVAGTAHGYFTFAVNGKPLLEFMHERIVEEDPSGGPSMAAKRYYDPRLASLGRRIVSLLKWTGLLMVETKKTYDDGVHYVLELNPKFWGSIDLSVKAGFEFPRILATYYLYGERAALEEVKRLEAREARYYWLMDSAHYLAVDPRTWLSIVLNGLRRPLYSDILGSFDPAKTSAQLAYSILRSFRYRRYASMKLRGNLRRVYRNFNSLLRRMLQYRRVHVSFDLDGTLVSLKVDWKKLHRELVEKGFAYDYESVMQALHRLYVRNPETFSKASSIVASYELEALRYLKPDLREKALINELRDRGVALYLVTMQSRRAAERALEILGIRDSFKWVVAREDSASRVEQLKKIKPSHPAAWIHVGDSMVDLIAAVRVGAFPVVVARSSYLSLQATRLGVLTTPSVEQFGELLVRVLRLIEESATGRLVIE